MRSIIMRKSRAIGNPSSALTKPLKGPVFSISSRREGCPRWRMRRNFIANSGRTKHNHHFSGNSSICRGGSATNVDMRFRKRCDPISPVSSTINSLLKPFSRSPTRSDSPTSGFDCDSRRAKSRAARSYGVKSPVRRSCSSREIRLSLIPNTRRMARCTPKQIRTMVSAIQGDPSK